MNCAYVNLIYNDNDNDFINILVSINSLINSHTKYDLILLYTLDVPQYKIDVLNKYFTKSIRIEYIVSLNNIYNKNIRASCTKLQIFNMTQYEKIIYISNELFINKNIDILFKNKFPSGVVYQNILANTSLLIIKPSNKIYNKLLEQIDNYKDIKHAWRMDVDILNTVFQKWNYLEKKYNFNYLIKEYQEDIHYLEKNLYITDFNYIEDPNIILTKIKNDKLKKNKKFMHLKSLYTQWFQIYMKLYNEYKKKGLFLNNPYSFIENDYQRYLKEKYPHLKIVKLDKKQQIKLNKKLNTYISPLIQFTFKQMINYLLQNNIPIFTYGGSIRNLFNEGEINDIDLLYIAKYNVFDDILLKSGLVYKQGKFKKYFYIGDEKELEFMNFDILKNTLNSPCNGLIYDFKKEVVYDLTGEGIQDAKDKIWRMSPTDDFKYWMSDIQPRILRLEKFLEKGYSVPKKDKINIYNDIYNNKQDRTYWIFFRDKVNDTFYDVINKDIDELDLKFSGQDMVTYIKKHVQK